jgi:hypothetical protein
VAAAEVVDHDREAGAMDLDPLLPERRVTAREVIDPGGRTIGERDLDVEALARCVQCPRVDRDRREFARKQA